MSENPVSENPVSENPRLYGDLAHLWPHLSSPEDYTEEAMLFHCILQDESSAPLETVLDLGCGGGNTANHLSSFYELTLVDHSPEMLEKSRHLNPGCIHRLGDMRTLRLGQLFDAVLILDAATYLTRKEDLQRAVETAFVHLRAGGTALFAPDHLRENFEPYEQEGGADPGSPGVRYSQSTYDPDSSDTTYVADLTYVITEENGDQRIERDRHTLGLFSRNQWLKTLESVGFDARSIPFEHSDSVGYNGELFLCRRSSDDA